MHPTFFPKATQRFTSIFVLILGLAALSATTALAQQFGPVITIPIEKVREHYVSYSEAGTRKRCGVRLYGEWPVYLNYTNRSSYTIYTPGLQSSASPQTSVPPGGRFRFYCYFNGIDSPNLDANCPTEIGNSLPDWHVEIRRRGPNALFTYRNLPPEPGQFEFTSVSTDPEEDPIVLEEWIFGDGGEGNGVSPVHRYLKPGVYPVRLTVTDSDGLTNANTVNITVPAPRLTVSLRLISKHENNRIEPQEVFLARATVAASVAGVGDLSEVAFTGPVLTIPTNLTLLEEPVNTDIGTLQPGTEKVFEWLLRGEAIGDFVLQTASLTGKDARNRIVTATRATALGTVTALLAGIEQRPERVVLGEDNNGDGEVNGADARVELILGVTNVTSAVVTELHTDNLEEPIRLTSRLFDVPVALDPVSIFPGDLGSIQPGPANAVFRTNIYEATNYVFASASVIVRGRIEEAPVQTGAETIAEVQSPGVEITMHALEQSGLNPESIANSDSIDAPLLPTTSTGSLASQPEVSAGLLGDGVTPLLFILKGDTKALAIQDDGLKVKLVLSVGSGGSLAGPHLQQRLRVLKGGAWVASDSVTLTQSEPNAFLHLTPIGSDEIQLSNARELRALLSVRAEGTGTVIEELDFRIARPLITLIHGYNTDGTWGEVFRAILEQTRPVVHTIRYGQGAQAADSGLPGFLQEKSGAMMANTLFSLESLVPMLASQLENDLKPLKAEWAFTRHDVVAHSQGGLLSRMLSSHNPVNVEPFRNEKNHYRGRFHRVVTIGSPHNGTRLVRYLLTLHRSAPPGTDLGSAVDFSLPRVLSQISVIGEVSQDKFDPWGDQIQRLNSLYPHAPWKPDPDAKFHLVQTSVNGGQSPSPSLSSWAELALGLSEPGVGTTVLPRGSDGVVDLESMGVTAPGGQAPPNVFRLPVNLDVSHAVLAGPDWVGDVFGGFDGGQVNAISVARHVIGALDQAASLPASSRQFGPFVVPRPLSPEERAKIDKAALSQVDSWFLSRAKLEAHGTPASGQAARQAPGERTFSLTLIPPADRPATTAGVFWFAEVFGTNGVSTSGLTLTPVPGSPFAATLEVASEVLGDVVAYAFYPSSAGGVVRSTPLRVVSFEPASPPERLVVLPADTPVPAGHRLRPQFFVRHADGLWLERFATPEEVSVVSSEPTVIAVTSPLAWRFLSSGKATVTVNWRSLATTNEVTVFGHQPGLAPVPDPLVWLRADAGLSLTNGTNVASWTDQSRNGFVFAASTEATQPAWVTNVINGLPVIRFTGANRDRLVGDLGRTLTNATIFTVCRFEGNASSAYAYAFGTRNFSGLMMTLARRSGNGAYHYDGAAERVAPNTIAGSSFHVFTQVYNGDQHQLARNAGMLLDTRTTVGRAYSAVATNVILGKYVTSTSTGSMTGDIVEWLVYDRVLSVEERLEVEEYLRQRIGLPSFFAPGSLDLATTEPVSYDAGGLQGAQWNPDLARRELTLPASSSPSFLLAPEADAGNVIRARLRSDGDRGLLGFVFGLQDRGEFLLFDWNRAATNHPDFGPAPAGMRLRAFHLPAGEEPTGTDFWSSPDPARVTLLASTNTPWAPGVDYDLVIRTLPDRLELEVRAGTTNLVAWSLPELPGVTGRLGFYAFAASGARLGELVLPEAPLLVTGLNAADDTEATLTWMNGRPPYVIEASTSLSGGGWFELSPSTPNLSQRVTLPGTPLFLRVRGADN